MLPCFTKGTSVARLCPMALRIPPLPQRPAAFGRAALAMAVCVLTSTGCAFDGSGRSSGVGGADDSGDEESSQVDGGSRFVEPSCADLCTGGVCEGEVCV